MRGVFCGYSYGFDGVGGKIDQMKGPTEYSIHYDVLFDYGSFYKSGHFSDVRLEVHAPLSQEALVIKGHRFVLGNSSKLFHSTLTAEMSEASSGIITVEFVDPALFERVIQFLYTGKLQFNTEEIALILNIARQYEIGILQTEILRVCRELLEEKDVGGFCKILDRIYTHKLLPELKLLEPMIAEHFKEMTIGVLTKNLDVPSFCRVMELLLNERKVGVEESLKLMDEFLGGYKLVPDDVEDLKVLYNGRKSGELMKTKTYKEVVKRWGSRIFK